MKPRALVTIGGGYANVVMATPVIHALHRRGYAVDALVESRQHDAVTLLSGWDALDTIYSSRRELKRREGGRGYDPVVRTVCHHKGSLGLGPSLQPDFHKGPLHEARLNLSALEERGLFEPEPRMHVGTDGPFGPLPKRFIAVGPGWRGTGGSNVARKAWKHWHAFCRLCHERTGLDLVLLGIEEDRAPWMRGKPWVVNLCGQTSIRGAAGVIARSEMVVCLDSALGHIGAALGKPVAAIFGATHEGISAPLGERVRVVTAGVPCRPCQLNERWESCKTWECMGKITPRAVMSAVEAAMEE